MKRLISTAIILLLATSGLSANIYVNKSYTHGNKSKFAGTAKLLVGDQRIGDSAYKIYGNASYRAYAYNRSASLAEIKTSLEGRTDYSNHSILEIKIVGYRVFNHNKALGYTYTSNYKPYYKQQNIATLKFPVGPIPIKVSIDASAEIKPVLQVGFDGNNGSIFASFGPQLSAGVVAEAGVELKFAGAGVRGTLNLITEKLEAIARAYLMQRSVNVAVQKITTGVNGKLELYAFLEGPGVKWKKKKKWGITVKYPSFTWKKIYEGSYKIAHFSSGQRTTVFVNGSFRI